MRAGPGNGGPGWAEGSAWPSAGQPSRKALTKSPRLGELEHGHQEGPSPPPQGTGQNPLTMMKGNAGFSKVRLSSLKTAHKEMILTLFETVT